ncbi:MAG: hypothetical protein AAGC93_13780 [Cyanobacteria bacterium P01_F01_bin.53]
MKVPMKAQMKDGVQTEMKVQMQVAAPAPRKGLLGALDRFIGPGATSAEIFLQLVPSVLAAIAANTYALSLPITWTPW